VFAARLLRLAPLVTGLWLAGAAPARAERAPPFRVGNVVVMPADDTLVTSDGMGGWGIVWSDDRSDPERITHAFYQSFPDDFDYLTVFTAFDDASDVAFPAYAYSVRNKVSGLGLTPYDLGKGFGSPARLKTWIDMKRSVELLADPKSFMWSTWAQEVGHLHLAHLLFSDQGKRSQEMLGRDKAHWSSLLAAAGSVMDGADWHDNADGTFTKIGDNNRYSPLDQYAFGVREADDVPPFFVLRDAFLGPDRLTATSYIPTGATITASAHPITIDDVMDASGFRLPQAGDADTDFRMAVVLLASPDQDPESVRPLAETLDGLLPSWEKRLRAFADGRASLCTRLAGDCARPRVAIDDVTLADGNGDGFLDPGEEITATLALSSPTGAEDVTVRLEASGLWRDGGVVKVGAIAPGGTASAALTFLPGAIACGTRARLLFRAETDGFTTLAVRTPVLGAAPLVREGFESDTGWHRAGDGEPGEGAWERGAPDGREALGVRVTPYEAFDGGNIFATGLAGGEAAGANDVDGREVLESPALDVTGRGDLAVTYELWWNTIERGPESFYAPTGDPFTVEASLDGGPFQEIDRVGRSRGMTNRWVERHALIPGTGQTLVLRFIAEDVFPDSPVEGAVDAVTVWGRPDACPMPTPPPDPGGGSPDGGCGCRIEAPLAPRGLPLALALAAMFLRRRHEPKLE